MGLKKLAIRHTNGAKQKLMEFLFNIDETSTTIKKIYIPIKTMLMYGKNNYCYNFHNYKNCIKTPS